MPWHVFRTQPPAKFIVVTGFRMQAQQTRPHVPPMFHQDYDNAVTAVAQNMTAGAMGCSGLVFDPNANDVQDYISKHLNQIKKNQPGMPLPSATALAADANAAQTARHALVRIAFVDTAGQHTQHFP